MLAIYANSFMTATGQEQHKLRIRQPSYAWYHIWHEFTQRLTSR